MSLAIWDVRFNSVGLSFGSPLTGLLSLNADPGPDRVRMLWGGPGAFGEPESEVFLPESDGSFRMPSDVRFFADGSYVIRAIGLFDLTGDRFVEVLTAFFDLNNTIGAVNIGNGLDNLMSGGSGDDTFYGQGGDDWVFGGNGSDLLFGGDGNDFLGGGGDVGADTLTGGAGSDLLAGDDGDDLLRGGTGTDFLYGGDGNDVILGQDGDDFGYGQSGDDKMVGGEGDDSLYGDLPAGDTSAGYGNDTLVGGLGRDALDGGDGDDLLRGQDGDDSLTGGGGNDTLDAGDGNDEFLYGNEGDDLLIGDAGFHRLNGGIGNDTMITTADAMTDWFVYDDIAEGYDRIIGFESGYDAFLILGIDDADVGPDRLVSGLGDITDNGTWIVYDSLGRLWFDMNGTDAGGLETVAVLIGAPTLTYDNFIFALPF